MQAEAVTLVFPDITDVMQKALRARPGNP